MVAPFEPSSLLALSLAPLGFGFLAALPAILSGAKALGSIFGGAAGGSADAQREREIANRNRESQQIATYSRAQDAQMQAGGLDLNRKQFDESSEGSRLKRALLGQLLGNGQDFSMSVPGVPQAKMSGGLSLSALGPDRQAMGAEMTARALKALRDGNQYQGGQLLPPPSVAPVGNTGGNGFLNALGLGASVIGGLGEAFGDGQPSLSRPSVMPKVAPFNPANLPGTTYTY